MEVVMPAIASAASAAVSSAVFISLTTTGEATASIVGRGIGISGVLLGHGAEYLLGPVAGDTLRILGFLGENTVRPALTTGTRTVAMGASVVAGAATAGVVAAASVGGRLLVRWGKEMAGRLLPARYIPTPAESDAIVEALAGTPRIQGIVRNLPIAAGFKDAGPIQALTPLEAAEAVAAAPWQILEGQILEGPQEQPEAGSDSESETPHPAPDAAAESAPESPKEAGPRIL